MDPVSIVTLIGTATKIVETCGSATLNIRKIRQQWKDAPSTLQSIESECETLRVTTKLMELWLHSYQRVDDDAFLEALYASLQYCSQALQGLELSTARLSKSGGSLRWRRLMQMIDDSILRRSRDEVRFHAQAAYQLWTVFNMYVWLYWGDCVWC